ncbi:MAG: hypothetical protein PHS82_14580 [Lachnospiraceae bacterium]|nr:hypothetical protein [Lachnospiraceae bacterium]
MKRTKIVLSLILVLCLTFCAVGCSSNHDKCNLKDNLIDGFNDWMQSFSKYALTKERNLQGDKTKGDDTYVGSYAADYEKFNGEEYIFGGTALERNNGSELKVTYTLKITSGTATLFWLGGREEHTIANSNADSTYDFTISSGDNYIILKGDNFSGSLAIKVE